MRGKVGEIVVIPFVIDVDGTVRCRENVKNQPGQLQTLGGDHRFDPGFVEFFGLLPWISPSVELTHMLNRGVLAYAGRR
jgi:hypothetical protein